MKKDNKFVSNLLKQMTLEEKIGQLYQTFYYGGLTTGPEFENEDVIKEIKQGHIGSILNISDVNVINSLQQCAINNSRLHIPLMFMLDVIHGFKISFPTPLSMSCSFNDKLIEKVARVSGYEAAHSGINVTFSPMLDYVNDARWGRVNESNGEDVYLNKRLAKAYVKGYQTNNLKNKNAVGACCKHFVGYGTPLAGREYNRTEISPISLYTNYLPSFQEAIKNNVLGVMFAFNSVNNIPVLANKEITKTILRDKLKFNGFTISDYGAASELINHKVAKDEKDVARICIANGLDQEMVSTCYKDYLLKVCQEDKKYIKYVNDSCYNILKAKYDLGLFTNPYKNIYLDNEKYFKKKENIEISYKIATQSILMLKNEILPLDKKEIVSILGDYAKEKSITGPWGGVSDSNDTTTIYDAFKENNDVLVVDDYSLANTVILCLGESDFMSGEGGSRCELTLPAKQEELLNELNKANKRIVLVIFAGRPLVLTNYINKCDSLLYSFYLGQEGGKAIRDIILGKVSPSAKTAMSFPYNVGQIPISYIDYPTGRPKTNTNDSYQRYVTHYIDCENEPLFIFGDGLSYNDYKYDNFKIDKSILKGRKDKINISFSITNNGNYNSEEIAFMFIEAKCRSVISPFNELKYYQRFPLNAKEKKDINFTLTYKDLLYINKDLKSVVDDGEYEIKIGTNLHNLEIFKIKYEK